MTATPDLDAPQKCSGPRACRACAGTGRVWDDAGETITLIYRMVAEDAGEPLPDDASLRTVFRCEQCLGTGRCA